MATEMKRSSETVNRIEELLGDEARELLDHKSQTIPKENIYPPGPDFIDRVVVQSDRSPSVLRSLQALINHGRLAGTGYVSILPVDQGIEHSAGASFAPNPQYFDPENIVKLAVEGGCNGVASTFGVLGDGLFHGEGLAGFDGEGQGAAAEAVGLNREGRAGARPVP